MELLIGIALASVGSAIFLGRHSARVESRKIVSAELEAILHSSKLSPHAEFTELREALSYFQFMAETLRPHVPMHKTMSRDKLLGIDSGVKDIILALQRADTATRIDKKEVIDAIKTYTDTLPSILNHPARRLSTNVTIITGIQNFLRTAEKAVLVKRVHDKEFIKFLCLMVDETLIEALRMSSSIEKPVKMYQLLRKYNKRKNQLESWIEREWDFGS